MWTAALLSPHGRGAGRAACFSQWDFRDVQGQEVPRRVACASEVGPLVFRTQGTPGPPLSLEPSLRRPTETQ